MKLATLFNSLLSLATAANIQSLAAHNDVPEALRALIRMIELQSTVNTDAVAAAREALAEFDRLAGQHVTLDARHV